MGISIAGIVINQNFENNLDELQKHFNWRFIRSEKVNVEAAQENWKGDTYCDIYFTENGTLIFLNIEMSSGNYVIPELNTLTFAMSETSMTFYLRYHEKGKLKRLLAEHDGSIEMDQGEKLPVEEDAEDMQEFIWLQMEEVLGKSFWSLEPEEKAMRYYFNPNPSAQTNKAEEKRIPFTDDPEREQKAINDFKSGYHELSAKACFAERDKLVHFYNSGMKNVLIALQYTALNEVMEERNLRNRFRGLGLNESAALRKKLLNTPPDQRNKDYQDDLDCLDFRIELMLAEIKNRRTQQPQPAQAAPAKKWWEFWK